MMAILTQNLDEDADKEPLVQAYSGLLYLIDYLFF